MFTPVSTLYINVILSDLQRGNSFAEEKQVLILVTSRAHI
jgi:hypothetical protein